MADDDHHDLRKSIGLHRAVLDMVPGRMAYWGPDMRCRFANRAFCEWVQRAPDEVVGRHAIEIFGTERIARVQPHIDAALAGQAQRFETEGQRPDGSALYNEINYAPDPQADAASGRHAFYFMAFDITRLKEAEFALQAANATMTRSRDEAESASRAKTAFLANMSHEMRTPMNAILGLTYLAARSSHDPLQRERLDKVTVAASHLLGLINEVLDLSKVEAGKLSLVDEPFATADIIERSLAMVRDQAARKGLALTSETLGLPARLTGDPLRLSQILINLLSNAVKFTQRGSVTLRASAQARPASQVALRFEVQDTGPGIAHEVQARLFRAFEQGENAANRSHEGAGLGLALSREMARAMGGDAGVVSEPGEGSTFWVSVLLGGMAGDAARGDAAAADGVGEAPPPALTLAEAEARLQAHHGQRVLLAEDNPINLLVGTSLLEAVGLVVEVAQDGEQAITLARAGAHHLILMDMQMPAVDGIEATQAIRRNGITVPIIAMTANAFSDDRDACLAAGMNDHVAKPVDPRVLYERLLRWLPAAA